MTDLLDVLDVVAHRCPHVVMKSQQDGNFYLVGNNVQIQVCDYDRLSFRLDKKRILGKKIYHSSIQPEIHVLALCLWTCDMVTDNCQYMTQVIQSEILTIRKSLSLIGRFSTAHKSKNQINNNENKITELKRLNYLIRAEIMWESNE